MSQFRYRKSCSAHQVNHVSCPIQTSNRIRRIVVTVMESSPVTLKGTCQSRSRTASVVNPAREGTQVTKFFRCILHHQNAGNTSGSLRVKGIHVNTVSGRLWIYFIRNGIPAHGSFRFRQAIFFTQYILHQEIRKIQTAYAVSIMMYVSPAASIRYSLVGDMVVHSHEFLAHFLFHLCVLRIVICHGNGFHQVEISLHFHAQLRKHVLVPMGNHTLVCFRLTYHKNRQSAHLTIFIYNLIGIILPANFVYLLLRQFTRCINQIPVALFHQVHILKLFF